MVVYGGRTEAEAQLKGLQKLGGADFKLYPIATIDPDTASAVIRGMKLDRTGSIPKAMKRMGREKTMRRFYG